MSDDIKKIQELVHLAEQELAKHKIESRYILDIKELRKVLPKTGLNVATRAKALGGTKIGLNEYMFENRYGPEKLARQLLAYAREEQSKMPQGTMFDRDFTNLGLAIARGGMSTKSFISNLPTGQSVINARDIENADVRRDLKELNAAVIEQNNIIAASVVRNLNTTTRALGYLIDLKGPNAQKVKEIKSTLEAKIKQYAEGDAIRTVEETLVSSAQSIFNGKAKPKAATTTSRAQPSKTKEKTVTITPKLRVLANNRLMITGQGYNKFTSVSSLMLYLNSIISRFVAAQMGKGPELTYRTGRFANNVKITSLVANRQQTIALHYDYMNSPYQTFEPGFKQGHKGYDPRRLIRKSIRQLMIQALGIGNVLITKVGE